MPPAPPSAPPPAPPSAPPHTLPEPPALRAMMDTGDVALFLDFDGTLVAIASDPDAIAVPHDLAAGLDRLAARMDGRLALISGRGLDDLETHLGPLNIARAGSHGADRRMADGTVLGDAPQSLGSDTLRALERVAREHGALLERKTHGAAVHYRRAPDAAAAVEADAADIARASGLVVKHGKCVVELVRPGASKAGAVDAFMAVDPFAGAIPVFIGDDLTDEDGFRAATCHGGFGIAVGDRRPANARYHIAGLGGVRAWLEL